jgi:outer membrane protein, heavy metal efflux system
MSINALCRAILYACVPAISLAAHAAVINSNAANPSSSSQPALAAFVRKVLDSNPGVQAAEAAVNAAQARERAAERPLYNPELGLDLEKAETDTGFLGLNQTIDWADKRSARTQVAAFEKAATSAGLAAVRQRLTGDLLSALTHFETTRELAHLTQRRANIMRRFAALSQRRYQAGDLNQVNLEVAKLAYAQANLRRAQAVANIIRARQTLIGIAGNADRAWPSLPAKFPTLKRSASDLETLLNALPRLRAERARIAAARSAVELRTRQRRSDPTVGLRGGSEQGEALIGINLSLPLFVRNTFSAELDAANANLIRIQQRAQNIYRRAKARLVSASQQYRITQGARQAWEQTGQQSSEMQLDLLRRLWQAGELSTTDFLVQFNQALNTQASAINLRGRTWQAWFEWLTASGRIDEWLGLHGS